MLPRRLGRPKVPNASRGDLEGDGAVKAQKGKSTQVLNIKKYNSVKDVTGKYQMTYSERGNGCKC